MKMLVRDAIEMLQKTYEPGETIFIWSYEYDEFEVDPETGENTSQARWSDPDVDDNCDLIDEMIRHGIAMLLRP